MSERNPFEDRVRGLNREVDSYSQPDSSSPETHWGQKGAKLCADFINFAHKRDFKSAVQLENYLGYSVSCQWGSGASRGNTFEIFLCEDGKLRRGAKVRINSERPSSSTPAYLIYEAVRADESDLQVIPDTSRADTFPHPYGKILKSLARGARVKAGRFEAGVRKKSEPIYGPDQYYGVSGEILDGNQISKFDKEHRYTAVNHGYTYHSVQYVKFTPIELEDLLTSHALGIDNTPDGTPNPTVVDR